MKGVIFSDLEGVLTKAKSIWVDLNIEMGMSEEEDLGLYNKYVNNSIDYQTWGRMIYEKWKKYSPEKLSRAFIMEYFKNRLDFREEAYEFVQECKKNFYFFVISSSSWENCELASRKLGFNNYYSTNFFDFDHNGYLKGIIGYKFGFEKDRIMQGILNFCGLDDYKTIAIGDSENDFSMLNKAKLGILIGENIKNDNFIMNKLNDNIIKMKKIDFKKILTIIHNKIDQYIV
jgi:HAD superfamily phosphoserine phosphatase-like hydrolase